MAKKKARRQERPHLAIRNRRRIVIAIAIVLSLFAAWTLLAYSVSGQKSRKGGTVSVASLNSSRPAKEYIYAGSRLIATEQPADHLDTIGLYDPSNGYFHLRNSNSSGGDDLGFGFGWPGGGLIPLSGDWNGDGIDTIGLYDPANAAFYLRNSNSGGFADITFTYGPAGLGWIPIAGDWNGDGIDTIGLYDPAHAGFFLRNSNSGGVADITFTYGPAGLGWIPIAGDWNGDGVYTIGLYDSTVNSAFFLRNTNSGGIADLSFNYGAGGWKPITGSWAGL